MRLTQAPHSRMMSGIFASRGFYMLHFHSTSLVRGLLRTLSPFVVVSVFVDVNVLVESSLMPAVCKSVLRGKAVSA